MKKTSILFLAGLLTWARPALPAEEKSPVSGDAVLRGRARPSEIVLLPRLGLVHYNTAEEVERTLRALEELLKCRFGASLPRAERDPDAVPLGSGHLPRFCRETRLTQPRR